MEAEAVEPAFVVFQSGADVYPCEFLTVRCVGVQFKAGIYEGSFGFGGEGSCGGVAFRISKLELILSRDFQGREDMILER